MSALKDKKLALQTEIEILEEELVKACKEHKKELHELEKAGAKKQIKEREKALHEEEHKKEKEIREKRNEARKITV